jgi:hypothetical protein
MLRRLFAVLAACLALLATQSAWAVPRFCRAEAEHRVCHCHHEAGMAMADDCCQKGERDSLGAPGIALPIPRFVAIRLPVPDVPAAERVAAADSPAPPAFVAGAPARGPPGTPRFLRLETLLI